MKDPKDDQQINLIRRHLKDVASQFEHGDFSGPSHIHGAQMPGLIELGKSKPGEIAIRYEDVPKGGEIQFSTHSAKLVSALHRWIDAQLTDHGTDAIEGHEHPADHRM